jgi:hypothetical protein
VVSPTIGAQRGEQLQRIGMGSLGNVSLCGDDAGARCEWAMRDGVRLASLPREPGIGAWLDVSALHKSCASTLNTAQDTAWCMHVSSYRHPDLIELSPFFCIL